MPIPAELSFENEADFNQKFLIPMLHRMGYSVVANFHGRSEFGKDIVFAEIDRFGHIRFNAIQSKFVESISLNAVEDLILDCKQAFANEFRHPQTGSLERISSFYAVSGGSISDQAIQHFFAALQPQYGANVRILQARDLLVLDRWSSTKGRADERIALTGLLLEIKFNRRQLSKAVSRLEENARGTGSVFTFTSVKIHATSAFLTMPVYFDPNFISLVEEYWSLLSIVVDLTATFRSRRQLGPGAGQGYLEILASVQERVERIGDSIEVILSELIDRLSPMSRNFYSEPV